MIIHNSSMFRCLFGATAGMLLWAQPLKAQPAPKKRQPLAAARALEQRILPALVRIKTERPSRRFVGITVAPGVVLVQKLAVGRKTRIWVRKLHASRQPFMEVKGVANGWQPRSYSERKHLPKRFTLLKLPQPLPRVTPFTIVPARSAGLNACFFILAENARGQVRVLPRLRRPSVGYRLAVPPGGLAYSWRILEAMPILGAEAKVYTLAKRKAFNVARKGRKRTAPTLSPEGWHLIPVVINAIARQRDFLETIRAATRGRMEYLPPALACQRVTYPWRFQMIVEWMGLVRGMRHLVPPGGGNGPGFATGIQLTPRLTLWKPELFYEYKGIGEMLIMMVALGGPPAWFGNQVSVEFPLAWEYVSKDHRGGRIQAGVALTFEMGGLSSSKRVLLPGVATLLLPEVGFAVTGLGDPNPAWEIYLNLLRIPFTYFVTDNVGIRVVPAMRLAIPVKAAGRKVNLGFSINVGAVLR